MNPPNLPLDQMSTTSSSVSEWHPQQEVILKRWAETALIFSLMHDHAHRLNRTKSLAFTLPVIIISSLTGTANFATNEIDPNHRYKLSMIIGIFNLLAGLITTIAQFLRINELVESHRAANVAFSKFYRTVSITLGLPLYDRQTSGAVFLETCRQEYDRLLEQSPVVPTHILNKYKAEIAKAGWNVPVFGLVPVSIYQTNDDMITVDAAMSTIRSLLCRLKSLREIDKSTEMAVLAKLSHDDESKDEEEKDDSNRCDKYC